MATTKKTLTRYAVTVAHDDLKKRATFYALAVSVAAAMKLAKGRVVWVVECPDPGSVEAEAERKASSPVPTVHLNGTSKVELLRQVREAARACGPLLEALASMTPHDRDYYPQGPDAGQAARKVHEARMGKVDEVHNELVALYKAILGAGT